MSIPFASIASIQAIRDERQWKRRDVLKVAILDDPQWLITLREPLVAKGLAGIRKEIRALALLPDEDEVIKQLKGDARPAAGENERRCNARFF